MNYIDKITFFEVFECDICHSTTRQIKGEYKKDTIARLRESGWKIGKYHTCPECSQSSVCPWTLAKTKRENPNIEIIDYGPIRILQRPPLSRGRAA